MFELNRPAPLTVRLQFQSRDQIELTLTGEVDVATAPELAPLADLLTHLDVGAVMIRLSRVSFVDSVGWCALEQLREHLEHAGIDVTVASTSAEPMIRPASLTMSSGPLKQEGQHDLVRAEAAGPADPSATPLVSAF